MIERRFQKGDADSWAVYSDCEHYRYLLTRVWNPEGRRALFVMLNPSTATEILRTIRPSNAASGARGRWGSARFGSPISSPIAQPIQR